MILSMMFKNTLCLKQPNNNNKYKYKFPKIINDINIYFLF